jgi:hypothetical protein
MKIPMVQINLEIFHSHALEEKEGRGGSLLDSYELNDQSTDICLTPLHGCQSFTLTDCSVSYIPINRANMKSATTKSLGGKSYEENKMGSKGTFPLLLRQEMESSTFIRNTELVLRATLPFLYIIISQPKHRRRRFGDNFLAL